jgi:hypothetical protein
MPGRSVVAVDVPQGPTAYQAVDRKYYGRSEFEAKALPDHEIRLRMSRRKTARATVELTASHGSLAHRRSTRAPQDGDPPLRSFEVDETLLKNGPHDEVLFAARLKNVGEVTIREPVVEFSVTVTLDPAVVAGLPIVTGFDSRSAPKNLVLYPEAHHAMQFGQSFPPGPAVRFHAGANLPPGGCVVRWTVYLDDAPPSRGAVDLGAIANGYWDRLRSEAGTVAKRAP